METLESFYGQGFRAQAFPANSNIEAVPKQNVRDRLAQATRDTKKGSYSKGNHSVEILTRLDPVKVRNASHHADRLIRALLGKGNTDALRCSAYRCIVCMDAAGIRRADAEGREPLVGPWRRLADIVVTPAA